MLFALEKSGTGPEGCMALDLLSLDESSNIGAIAYVRAFSNFCQDGIFSQDKVSKISSVEINPDWKSQCSILDQVGSEQYDEYKILCSPTLLFLHIDQGVEKEVVTYVPFATPKVNCRAINSTHILTIAKALNDGKETVTTSGDYSIFPFEVDVGTSTSSGTRYRSILTRDAGSHYISGKLAVPIKMETVQYVQKKVRILADNCLVILSISLSTNYFCTFTTLQFFGEDVLTLHDSSLGTPATGSTGGIRQTFARRVKSLVLVQS